MSNHTADGAASSAHSENADTKLSWSTEGSVKKNLPHLLSAHSSLLADQHASQSPQTMLEIASGFGDHILAYAERHPDTVFWPTECNDFLVDEISRQVTQSACRNVRQPIKLDVTSKQDWHSLRQSMQHPFAVVSVTNLFNVAPWYVTQQLFEEIGPSSSNLLDPHAGVFAVYCCLKIGGEFQSEADAKFDKELRLRNPEFGIRDLEAVVELAAQQGLHLSRRQALGGGTNIFLEFRYQK